MEALNRSAPAELLVAETAFAAFRTQLAATAPERSSPVHGQQPPRDLLWCQNFGHLGATWTSAERTD